MDLLGPCTNVFLTAYAHVRTEPQSDIGQTRGKKHLAYGSFKVSDPLEWDVWDTSKLLACLVEQFGGGINFVCSDLTQCQLSN